MPEPQPPTLDGIALAFCEFRQRTLEALARHVEEGLMSGAFRVEVHGEVLKVIVPEAPIDKNQALLLLGTLPLRPPVSVRTEAPKEAPPEPRSGSGAGSASTYAAVATVSALEPSLVALAVASLEGVRAALLGLCARMAAQGRCHATYGRPTSEAKVSRPAAAKSDTLLQFLQFRLAAGELVSAGIPANWCTAAGLSFACYHDLGRMHFSTSLDDIREVMLSLRVV